jgi:hypothetical protein
MLFQEKGTWWSLFPIFGLDLLDENYNFSRPLFGDATIISKRHIKQIISQLKLNDDTSFDHERDLLDHIERMVNDVDYHSYIAVRRHGTADNVEKSSSNRAYSISAIVSLMLLASSNDGRTSGLVEQFHRRSKGLTQLDFERSLFGVQTTAYTAFTQKDPLKIRSEELLTMMQMSPFDSLFKIVIPQTSTLPKSIRMIVMQSAIRLGNALHTAITATHLLGAVTTIEMMLSEQGEKYDTNKTRLTALLGAETLEHFDYDSVIRSRHLYVHNGIEPEDYKTSRNAVALAMSCLLMYAKITFIFKTKKDILEYLDLVYRLDSYFNIHDEKNLHVLNSFMKHQREEFNLPFLKTNEPRDGLPF